MHRQRAAHGRPSQHLEHAEFSGSVDREIGDGQRVRGTLGLTSDGAVERECKPRWPLWARLRHARHGDICPQPDSISAQQRSELRIQPGSARPTSGEPYLAGLGRPLPAGSGPAATDGRTRPTAPTRGIRGALELLAHARLISLLRMLSVRILTDVNVGAIGFSGHSRH